MILTYYDNNLIYDQLSPNSNFLQRSDSVLSHLFNNTQRFSICCLDYFLKRKVKGCHPLLHNSS